MIGKQRAFKNALKGVWLSFALIANAWSAEPSALPASSPNAGLALLQQRATAITKTSMQVVKEDEGVVSLTPYLGHSLVNQALVIFFRRKGARVEIIANGKVTGERKVAGAPKFEILVQLDRDAIVKYPQSGDYAVPMADPNALGNGNRSDQFDYLMPEDTSSQTSNDRPGYFEFGMGLMQGTLTTDASSSSLGATVVNGAKKTSGYRFKNIHLGYYSDFLPVGIEYDSHGGNFPTQTYYSKIVKSNETVSNLSLVYRFSPWFHQHLAPILKVGTLSDEFSTDNEDENLLNSKITGTGFGGRINYDLVSPLWTPEKNEFFAQLQNVYAEAMYYPSITATDGAAISRGISSAGSSGLQYRLGFNTLLYLKFVPVFKRLVFSGSYGVRQYSLKFSGATTSEPGNPNKIVPGGTSKEKEQDFRFFFGVRFEDPVQLLFGKPHSKGNP